MQPDRPTSVTVVAIINLVLGVLGLCMYSCGGLGILMLFSMADRLPPEQRGALRMFQAMEEVIPGYLTYMVVMTLLGVLATAILLVSAIGLLRLNAWGRWLTIGCAVYFIVGTVVNQILQFAWFRPHLERIQREMVPAAGRQPSGQLIGEVFGLGIAFVEVVYAIALLVIMYLPDVRAAFAGEVLAPPPPEDYDDRRFRS